LLIRLPQLDVTRLAADFSAAMRERHTAGQLATIRERNAAEPDATVDHAHDYHDAHEIMAGAISDQLGTTWSWPDISQDACTAFDRARKAGYQLSRVLIACEFSGAVRDEFAARGHSATSCDILDTETPGNHYRGDVRDILGDGYHLMIAHPPCTYLAACQLWRCQPKHDAEYPARQIKSDEALAFVRDLLDAPVPQIALENPVGRIGTAIRPADQYIQPYEFGHDVSKRTGLWLDGLPPLQPTDYVPPTVTTYDGRTVNRWANQSPCGADSRGPSADRGHDRSRTYAGIARAMAEQWGRITERLTPAATQPLQLDLI